MANDARETQVAVETHVDDAAIQTNETQAAVEVHVTAVPPGVYATQVAVEAHIAQGGGPAIRVTQVAVEVWYELGIEPVSRIVAMRRLRQFALPTSESNKWLFLQKLELLMQTGSALISGQGSDPQVMIQLSRDWGYTWGPEQWVSAGLRGEYDRRVILRRLGRMRSGGYVRLVVSDPIQWTLLNALAELTEGTS